MIFSAIGNISLCGEHFNAVKRFAILSVNVFYRNKIRQRISTRQDLTEIDKYKKMRSFRNAFFLAVIPHVAKTISFRRGCGVFRS